MKKQFLLFALICTSLAFSQSSRTNDVEKSTTVAREIPPINYPKTPTKTYEEYLSLLNTSNIVVPSLKKQEPTAPSSITSQQFSGTNTNVTSAAADDFVVPANTFWEINEIYVSGVSSGPKAPSVYNITIYANTSANLPGLAIRTETVTLTSGSYSPTLPLSTPLTLGGGTYWLSVQAVMDLVDGQWFWRSYADSFTYNSPFIWQNPGGGFNTSCASWTIASTCVPNTQKDLQFSINGTTFPACKTITGRIGATDPTHSPRLFRDANASYCGWQKPYPGTSGTGNFRYKTYMIQNTSSSAQCVNVSLINADTANVFLAAYSTSFNATNLSQNYLADTGSSSTNGTPVSMSFTMPANSTIILVASEVTSGSVYSADYTINVAAPNCTSLLKIDENGKMNVSLYPNPTTGKLFVNGTIPQNVKVFDTSGKMIPVKNTSNEIDVTKLTKGTYLIQYEDKNGVIYKDKFIKN